MEQVCHQLQLVQRFLTVEPTIARVSLTGFLFSITSRVSCLVLGFRQVAFLTFYEVYYRKVGVRSSTHIHIPFQSTFPLSGATNALQQCTQRLCCLVCVYVCMLAYKCLFGGCVVSCMSICTPLTALGWALKWALVACPPLVLAIVACSVCYWNIRSARQQAASPLLGDHLEAAQGCAVTLFVLIVNSWQFYTSRVWLNLQDFCNSFRVKLKSNAKLVITTT